jgi:hypothetical protein
MRGLVVLAFSHCESSCLSSFAAFLALLGDFTPIGLLMASAFMSVASVSLITRGSSGGLGRPGTAG